MEFPAENECNHGQLGQSCDDYKYDNSVFDNYLECKISNASQGRLAQSYSVKYTILLNSVQPAIQG